MKKIILPLLLILMLFTVSCAKSDVPEGFKAAHTAGEPFRLYVPEDWILNTAGGVSGAYVSSNKKISVSARYYAPQDTGMTLDGYLDFCSQSYAETLGKFEIISREASVLGGFDAQQLVYAFEKDGVKFIYRQISTKHSGLMISFNYSAPEEYYEFYSAAVNSMVKEFIVTGTLDYPNEEVVDKNTPDGMKIASAAHLSFRMYVPKSWICTPSDGGSTAIYIADGVRSNVTVTSYSPDEIMTAAEFADYCAGEYRKNVSGFNLIEKTDAQMAGRPAVRMVFGAEYDGFSYKILQVSVIRDEIAFTLTYTALADKFDAALADAEKIIESFEFR